MSDLNALLDQFARGSTNERVAAAHQLAAHAAPEVAEAFRAALNADDTAVIRAAAEAILQRGDRADVPFLLAALDEDADDDAADEIASVLRTESPRWLIDEVFALADQTADAETRIRAIGALGYPLHVREAIGVLTTACSDEDRRVHEAARAALDLLKPSSE